MTPSALTAQVDRLSDLLDRLEHGVSVSQLFDLISELKTGQIFILMGSYWYLKMDIYINPSLCTLKIYLILNILCILGQL